VRVRAETLGETRPRPVLRATNEAGAERTAFDESGRADELGGCSDWHCIARSPVDRLHRVASLSTTCGVGMGYPVQELMEIAGFDGTQHQVPPIGQETVGDQSRGMASEAFFQHPDQGPIITRALQYPDFFSDCVLNVKEPRSQLRKGWRRHVSTSVARTAVARVVPVGGGRR